MRARLLSLALVTSLAACGGASTVAKSAGSTPSAPAEVDPANERLGSLGADDPATEVVAVLGEPTDQSDPVEYAATGETWTQWGWPAQGAWLAMMLDATAPGGARVATMMIRAPSTLTTSRGVGIGTPRADVERIYGPYLGVDPATGENATSNPDQLIVGSLYGGTMFSFTDGVVSEIFVGASAE